MWESSMGDEKVTGRAKGGVARAAALTPERRREIGRLAIEARWPKHLPSAVYGSPDRPVRVGNVELQCYVLDDKDETRVLTQAGFLQALGRHRKANVRDEGTEEPVPPILQGKGIKPFISQELLEKSRPIKFRLASGLGKTIMASGYRAETLPMARNGYFKTRGSKQVPSNQLPVANQTALLRRDPR